MQLEVIQSLLCDSRFQPEVGKELLSKDGEKFVVIQSYPSGLIAAKDSGDHVFKGRHDPERKNIRVRLDT